MAKFYGPVGFAQETIETEPGVWNEPIVERNYFGDLIRNNRKLQQASNSVNDDINISNQISILADPYANDNFYAIRYVTFRGTRWKVNSVDVQYPRLILELGGVYNGPTP